MLCVQSRKKKLNYSCMHISVIGLCQICWHNFESDKSFEDGYMHNFRIIRIISEIKSESLFNKIKGLATKNNI